MGKTITEKIITEHLVEGQLIKGQKIGISIDQILMQDISGTLVCLEFEQFNIPKVRTESFIYVDHNTLQTTYRNADDHLFLKSFASKYGCTFSPPGNGICHQLHIFRFAVPGKTLLGADSHTSTSGSIGMLAIGAGGLTVASATAGYPFYLQVPEIYQVQLKNRLNKGVSSKDIILELLRQLGVKGNTGRILEFSGDGLLSLSVLDRATICNMGAELGVITSIFPSDEVTHQFMQSQERIGDFKSIQADENASYDKVISLDLSKIEPLIALPHSPGNIIKVRDIEGLKVDQVYIGSCTNSSYSDFAKVAAILDGKIVHPEVSLVVSPGSRQIFQMLVRDGIAEKLISSGARILECACGPCIGMGQAPSSGGISIRTSNRNFKGRCGTENAKVYLTSPETAAITSLFGKITDPLRMSDVIPNILVGKIRYIIDDRMFIFPKNKPKDSKLIRGTNIKSIPRMKKLNNNIKKKVILKLAHNISTDDILPSGVEVLSYRSNIPKISQFLFRDIEPSFFLEVKESQGGIIIAGENYGQGSSREHAALAPKHVGIEAVIALSFARIHFQNLINFGILPLCFLSVIDYKRIKTNDILEISNLKNMLNESQLNIKNVTQNYQFQVNLDLSKKEKNILLEGGLINYSKNKV